MRIIKYGRATKELVKQIDQAVDRKMQSLKPPFQPIMLRDKDYSWEAHTGLTVSHTVLERVRKGLNTASKDAYMSVAVWAGVDFTAQALAGGKVILDLRK